MCFFSFGCVVLVFYFWLFSFGVLILVVYGISTKGLNPLIDKIGARMDDILILLNIIIIIFIYFINIIIILSKNCPK